MGDLAQQYRTLSLGVMALGGLTFVALFFITAGYGRHRKARTRFCCSNRAGWIIMEIPAVLGFLGVVFGGQYAAATPVWILVLIWMSHYGYRTLIYPFRLTYVPTRMPLEIALIGCCFQSLNAYLNGTWISQLHKYEMSWFLDWRFVVGVGLFYTAFAGNLWSDEILLRLKKSAPDRYQIPHGGLFRWLSSPNYVCEILEWGGWALLTWSLSGTAFFVYTFANLAPRAFAHHRWYQTQFEDYPKERKALIPGLL